MQDRNGIIWLGMPDGVYRYNGKVFSRFLEEDSIHNSDGVHLKNIQCLLEDKKGNIWFGSGMSGREGVSRFDGKSVENFKPNGDVWIVSMLEDKAGHIWFSGRNNGHFRYDGETFTNLQDVAIFPDHKGRVRPDDGRQGREHLVYGQGVQVWWQGRSVAV